VTEHEITVQGVPQRVEEFVRVAVREHITGSVTLHFVSGALRSWELRETGRDQTRLTGERTQP
jgi:hypothetical protein